MFCRQCGKEIIEGASFCSNCGTPVPDAVAQPDQAARPSAAAPVQQAARSVATAPVQQAARPAAAIPAQQAAHSAPQPSAGIKKTPIIVVAIICVIAVLAVAGFVLFSGSSKTVKLDASSVPDEHVRATLTAYDADGDGTLSETESQSITDLTFENAEKIDIPAAISNLQTVTVKGNTGTEFKLPNGNELVEVVFENPSVLETVDIRNAPKLETLDLTGSALTTIDISGMTALKTINLTGTNITELDVSHNSNLRYIIGGDNVALKGLDKIGLKEYFVPTEITATSQLSKASATLGAVYDDDNRLSAVTIKSSSTSGWVTSGTTTYSYDDNDRPTGYVMTANGSEIKRVTWTYNDKGQITTATSKFPSSSIALTSKYTYNDKGQLTESDIESNWLISSYASYDANGNIASFTGGAHGLTQKDGTTFSYDSDGRLASFTSSTGNIASGTITYDADGNCTGIQQTYVQGSTSTENNVTYTYDDNGLITKANMASGVSAHVYGATDLKYDRFGNLTSMAYSASASPYAITIKYTRFLCTEDNAPLGSIRETTDPLDMSGYLPGNGETSNYYSVWDPVSMATDARDIIFGAQTTRYQKSGQVKRMAYVEHKTLEPATTTASSSSNTQTTSGTTVSTDLYELTLPASWADKVTVGEMEHTSAGYFQYIKLKGTDTVVLHIMVDPMGIGGAGGSTTVYSTESNGHRYMILEFYVDKTYLSSNLSSSLNESDADQALSLVTNGQATLSDVKSGTDPLSMIKSYFSEAIEPTIKLK